MLKIKAMQLYDLISKIRNSNHEPDQDNDFTEAHKKTSVAVFKHNSSNKVSTLSQRKTFSASAKHCLFVWDSLQITVTYFG